MTRRVLLAGLLFGFLYVPGGFAATNPSFSDRHEYPDCYGNDGPSVAPGDFNGDGIPDLVCSDLYVFLGNGDGSFGPGNRQQVFAAANNPVPVDLNGDGKIDIVAISAVGDPGPYGIVVTFGNGDGTFQPGTF